MALFFIYFRTVFTNLIVYVIFGLNLFNEKIILNR